MSELTSTGDGQVRGVAVCACSECRGAWILCGVGETWIICEPNAECSRVWRCVLVLSVQGVLSVQVSPRLCCSWGLPGRRRGSPRWGGGRRTRRGGAGAEGAGLGAGAGALGPDSLMLRAWGPTCGAFWKAGPRPPQGPPGSGGGGSAEFARGAQRVSAHLMRAGLCDSPSVSTLSNLRALGSRAPCLLPVFPPLVLRASS